MWSPQLGWDHRGEPSPLSPGGALAWAPTQPPGCLVPSSLWDAEAGHFLLQKKLEVSTASVKEICPIRTTLRAIAVALGLHRLPGPEVCWVTVA